VVVAPGGKTRSALRDHEEEQTIDEAEKVLCVVTGLEVAIGDGFAQFSIRGMSEEAGAKVADGVSTAWLRPSRMARAGIEGV